MHPYVHHSIIHNSQAMEVPKCPSIDDWIKNSGTLKIKIVVHLHNAILLGHEKNELFPFATSSMDPEGIMLSEISQSEKDKYTISLIYGIKRSI